MQSRYRIAVDNFIGHCQAVPEALGSSGTVTAAFSANNHTLDIPYPHGITTAIEDQIESQLSQIRSFVASRPDQKTTWIVDSGSKLDLEPLGFSIAFDTPWLYREPQVNSEPTEPKFVVERVQTPSQLRDFDQAAAIGFGQKDSSTVYAQDLLQDARYDFYYMRRMNRIVAGVQTFTDGESVGIYTLFTHTEHQRKGYATTLVNHVLSRKPEQPAITNPGDQSYQLFLDAGFKEIGKRTLWRHG